MLLRPPLFRKKMRKLHGDAIDGMLHIPVIDYLSFERGDISMVVRHNPLLAQYNWIIPELLIEDLPVLLEGLFHGYFPVTFFPSVDEGTFDPVPKIGEYFCRQRSGNF